MRLALVLAIAAAVVGLLYAATLSHAEARCEVCMAFGERQTCATAAAATRGDAELSAVMTACAVLTSGVTATLQCQGQMPISVRCD